MWDSLLAATQTPLNKTGNCRVRKRYLSSAQQALQPAALVAVLVNLA